MKNIRKYYFSALVAKDVGVEEAVMLSNLYFWVEKNKNDARNLRDGKYWTFNSVSGFTEQFEFWSSSQIRRILKNLKAKGYIETGRYNRLGYDKTTWYTVTEKTVELIESDSEFVKSVSPVDENINPFFETDEVLDENI